MPKRILDFTAFDSRSHVGILLQVHVIIEFDSAEIVRRARLRFLQTKMEQTNAKRT